MTPSVLWLSDVVSWLWICRTRLAACPLRTAVPAVNLYALFVGSYVQLADLLKFFVGLPVASGKTNTRRSQGASLDLMPEV